MALSFLQSCEYGISSILNSVKRIKRVLLNQKTLKQILTIKEKQNVSGQKKTMFGKNNHGRPYEFLNTLSYQSTSIKMDSSRKKLVLKNQENSREKHM